MRNWNNTIGTFLGIKRIGLVRLGRRFRYSIATRNCKAITFITDSGLNFKLKTETHESKGVTNKRSFGHTRQTTS